METNKQNNADRQPQDANSDSANQRLHSNENASGKDQDQAQDEVNHHQQFGNRKYESHTNHSSNDDQAMTDTSPTGSSPTLS